LRVVADRALRAPRANRAFGADERHIRAEGVVMDRGNNVMGLFLYKALTFASPGRIGALLLVGHCVPRAPTALSARMKGASARRPFRPSKIEALKGSAGTGRRR
jgi:hypothetical protein